jgi:hypothetical protein
MNAPELVRFTDALTLFMTDSIRVALTTISEDR